MSAERTFTRDDLLKLCDSIDRVIREDYPEVHKRGLELDEKRKRLMNRPQTINGVPIYK